MPFRQLYPCFRLRADLGRGKGEQPVPFSVIEIRPEINSFYQDQPTFRWLYVKDELPCSGMQPEDRRQHYEVTLTFDKRIAQRKWLCHTRHRHINGSVAMRMVVSNHVTDCRSRLTERSVICYVILIHGVEDSALTRLQSVTNIRQRTTCNNTH